LGDGASQVIFELVTKTSEVDLSEPEEDTSTKSKKKNKDSEESQGDE
jgi:hypothetical protein